MEGKEAGEAEPLLESWRDSTSPPALVDREPPHRISAWRVDIEDPESSAAPCCRICLEGGSRRRDELISPCMCKGTQQFVHRSCLDQWRSVREGFAFSHCTTCKAQFHLHVAIFDDHLWRKMKFRFFVARDVLFVFLIIQMIIIAFGSLAYLLDLDGSFRNSFSDDWERVLSKHPIPFYYCVGVVVFLVGMGIFGLLSLCSSSNNWSSTNATESYANTRWGGDTASCNCCIVVPDRDCNCDCGEAAVVILVILVVIFLAIGVIYSLFAATIAIQHIWQKHYHILAKRELTKEYVVVDLHGCYTPPVLHAEHEERLKALNLL